MLYCSNCGKPLDDQEVYCTNCGQNIEEYACDSSHTPIDDGHPKRANKGNRRNAVSHKPPYLTIALVVLLALAANGLAIWIMQPSKPKPNSQIQMIPEGQPTDEPTYGIAVQPDVSGYSWSDLSLIANEIASCTSSPEALAVAKKYNLLDSAGRFGTATKDITLSDGRTVHMRLVGIWHDEANTPSGKAGLSFLSDSIVSSHTLSNIDVLPGGWQTSEMKRWLNEDLWHMLPAEVSELIVEVQKSANNVGYSRSTDCVSKTAERLWLPSIVELCGPVDWVYNSDPSNSSLFNAIINQEGEQYAAFAQEGIDSFAPNTTLALGGEWWVRTLSPVKGNGRYVGSDGNPSLFGSADKSRGVVIGFCL